MLDPATQRPRWALEVEWSDRSPDRPEELAALHEFAARHHRLRLVATTRTRALRTTLPWGPEVHFVPTALLAFALGHLSASPDGGRAIAAGGVFDCTWQTGIAERGGNSGSGGTARSAAAR